MEHVNCVYDPNLDQNPVDQVGYVDLVKVAETGAMPATVSGVIPDYNECEDPGSLMEPGKDAFERIRKAKHVIAANADASSEGDAVTSASAE